MSLLFPSKPREFPGRRWIKILVRAVHVLCAGVLVGSYLFEAGAAAQTTWLTATVLTGGSLLALDLHETAAFALQLRGLLVAIKLVVVITIPWQGAVTPWLLVGLMLLAVVLSHAPSKLRYRLLWGQGKVVPATSKG